MCLLVGGLINVYCYTDLIFLNIVSFHFTRYFGFGLSWSILR